MPWSDLNSTTLPTGPNGGKLVTLSRWDQLILAVATWIANVNAGGFSLANLASLTFAAGGGITQDNPTLATLGNSWTNVSSSANQFARASYVLDKQGYVTLGGFLTPGTLAANTTIFTLPVGYRPASGHIFGVPGFNGSATVYGTVKINLDGTVQVVHIPTGLQWVSISGIHFQLLQ